MTTKTAAQMSIRQLEKARKDYLFMGWGWMAQAHLDLIQAKQATQTAEQALAEAEKAAEPFLRTLGQVQSDARSLAEYQTAYNKAHSGLRGAANAVGSMAAAPVALATTAATAAVGVACPPLGLLMLACAAGGSGESAEDKAKRETMQALQALPAAQQLATTHLAKVAEAKEALAKARAWQTSVENAIDSAYNQWVASQQAQHQSRFGWN